MTSDDGTSWHLLCGKRSQLVPSSDTHLVGYQMTLLVATCGTSWHLLVVRVDMGTSWHGYELTWVRADMGTSWQLLCGNICQLVLSSDTCLVWYELTSNGGTSWHHLWYELTSIGGTSWHGYELTWVRVDMGTSWHGYELTCIPYIHRVKK